MRSCGPCTACCTALGVQDVALKKPRYAPCRHECAGGCAIYAARPEACRKFACAWLLGHGGDGERPDLSGTIIEVSNRDRCVSISAAPGFDIDSPGVRTAEVTALALGIDEVQVFAAGRARITKDGVVHHCRATYDPDRTVLLVERKEARA